MAKQKIYIDHLDYPSADVYFDARKAEMDADGRSIKETYATKDQLELVKQDQKVADKRIDDVAKANAVNAKAIDANRDSLSQVSREGKANAEDISANAAETARVNAAVEANAAETKKAIEDLKKEIYVPIRNEEKDKGAYLSENLLLKAVTPVAGDYALVLAPNSVDGAFSPTGYWGERYLGEDTTTSWHESSKNIKNYYYKHSNNYYMVVVDMTLSSLADATFATLLEHKHIVQVTIYTDTKPSIFYICANNGEWQNTLAVRSVGFVENIQSYNMFDGEDTQETLNEGNRVNAMILNGNNSNIRRVLGMCVKKLNEMQTTAAFVGDFTYEHIPDVNLVDVSEQCTIKHDVVGSPFPLEFSSNKKD